MSRDHRKLEVFQIADELVLRIYKFTNDFPDSERYGLQSQLRRASVSAASCIVEGCARRTTAEYVNFLNFSAGSSSEARYLTTVARRLEYGSKDLADAIYERYDELCAKLQALINSQGPEPTWSGGQRGHRSRR